MKSELGQSVDHLRRAASLAAQETSATVGPKFNAAVERVQPVAGKARDAASTGWDAALATITPLVTAATDNARQTAEVSKKTAKKAAKQNKKSAKLLERRANKAVARQQSGRRKSKLAGWALLGAAVGVGAAYVAKRRKSAQWDEYDPIAPIGPATVAVVEEPAAFEPVDEPTLRTSPNGTSDSSQRSTP
jgi:hypothetical protein